jgi:6-pyruvoyltetrahydropterin/6-carboxytetrahydropterin synthase
MEYSVQVRGEFESGHIISGDAECGRLHGHRYSVEVEAPLKFDAAKRQTTDTAPLRHAVREMCRELDHRSINEMIPGVSPTPDGIAAWFLERLMLAFPRVRRVTVSESPQCAFTVTREVNRD